MSRQRASTGAKGISHLRGVAARHRVCLDPDKPKRLAWLMECPELAVPDEPELPEVHLRFLEAFSVVPAVKFCAAQDGLERAQPVVQACWKARCKG